MTDNRINSVLCISGHDPSGGAGIQADIEAINNTHSFALSVISCMTIQDSKEVYSVIPVDSDTLQQQIQTLISDSQIAAIKIGLLCCTQTIEKVLASIEPLLPHTPLIIDPVLSAGGSGKALNKQNVISAFKKQLLPRTSILTPNTHELYRLTAEKDPDKASRILLQMGVKNILLTGTHNQQNKDVINTLYQSEQKKSWHWQRLQHSYHGSGCTLAASLASYIAQGFDVESACFKAQQYTWNTLASAFKSGKGQWTPRRKN